VLAVGPATAASIRAISDHRANVRDWHQASDINVGSVFLMRTAIAPEFISPYLQTGCGRSRPPGGIS
jgi:hypothetical protein